MVILLDYRAILTSNSSYRVIPIVPLVSFLIMIEPSFGDNKLCCLDAESYVNFDCLCEHCLFECCIFCSSVLY